MSGLFASDYDGTLHFWKEEPPFHKEDLEAIQAFQKKGNLFGICTGRTLASIQAELSALDQLHPDFIIAASGAVITDGKGKILYADYVDFEDLKAVYDLCGGEHMFVPLNERYLSLSSWRLPYPGNEQEEDARLEDFQNADVDTFSMEVFASPEEIWQMVEKLGPVSDRLSYFVNEPSSIDFTAKGNNKGEGVKKAAALFGVDLAHTASMGDSFNDTAMLEKTAQSYTFEKSHPKVRACAKKTAGSVAQALADFEKVLESC